MENIVAKSPEYEFYRSLFPGAGAFVRPLGGLQYDQAKALFADRFKLTHLTEILNSWQNSAPQLTTDNFDNYYGKEVVYFYHYDKLLYRSTLWGTTWQEPKGKRLIRSLNIKLSNDGFLYPHTNELKVFRSDIRRHDGDSHWTLLDREQAITTFSHHIAFAKSYFKTTKVLDVKVFYNFFMDRIDFKAWFGEDELVISYEPGFPETDFNDEWQKV